MLRSENVRDEALLAAIIKASASGKERSVLQAAAQTPEKVVNVHEKTVDKKKLSLSSMMVLYLSLFLQ